MILSNKQFKQIKKAKYHDSFEYEVTMDLVDTIETLQQENEELQTTVRERTKWWQDEARYTIKLEQQVKQLKAQAAVMREALKSIYYGPYQMHKGYVEILEEALATDAGKDYHNPADIEALKKAKYAIECLIKHYTGPAFSLLKYGKVIEAIDKAIGGDHNA
jgi:FtsZ-binding cell division protein ZapB